MSLYSGALTNQSVSTPTIMRAGVFLDGGGSAEADGTGDRHDDVCAFVDQVLAELLALVLVVEVTGEETVLLGIVPTEHLHIGAVLLR